MEISLREWLIVGGIIVIALILFDGWRRIRANRNRLKIDIDKSLAELGNANHHNPELPNGGARVRSFDNEPFISDLNFDSENTSNESKSSRSSLKSTTSTAAFTATSLAKKTSVEKIEPDISLTEQVDTPRQETSSVSVPEVDESKEALLNLRADVYPETLETSEENVEPSLEIESSSFESIEETMTGEKLPEETLSAESRIQEETLQVESIQDESVQEETVQEEIVQVELEQEKLGQDEQIQDEQVQEERVQEKPVAEELTEEEHSELEWHPDLEKQFEELEPQQNFNTSPKDKAFDTAQTLSEQTDIPDSQKLDETDEAILPDLKDLDPLFDDIPTEPLAPIKTTDKPEDKQANLYLDLDLDQPIHQIMVNKAAENKAANREVARKAKEKTPAREEKHASLSLPLEPELNDLFAEAEAIDSLELPPVEDIPAKPFVAKTDIPVVEQEKVQRVPEQPRVPEQKSIADATPTPMPAAVTPSKDTEKSRAAASAARKALSDLPDPEEVLVITVVGKDRQFLDGERLKRVVEACGMEHGDMSIYHRFDGTGSSASLQFSMANAVNPGTFDPEAMDKLETPAVSFFMSMREPRDAMTAYECMLATAETLAKNLNGDLLDEDRSVMREQTKEHYRQRIRDFEMQSRRRNLTR